MTSTTKRSAATITLYGNLGSDPKVKTFASREVSEVYFNAELGGPDTRTVTKPGGEFHSFSVAVNLKDDNGAMQTAWVDVTDYGNLAALHNILKGDRVAIVGTFKERPGTERTFRNFILKDLRVERRAGTVVEQPSAEVPDVDAGDEDAREE